MGIWSHYGGNCRTCLQDFATYLYLIFFLPPPHASWISLHKGSPLPSPCRENFHHYGGVSSVQTHCIETEHKPRLYAHLNDSNNAGSIQANAAELVPSEYAVVLSSIVFGSSWVCRIVHSPVALQMLSPYLYDLCYAHCIQVITFPWWNQNQTL